MNNHRLLTGLLLTVVSSSGALAIGQRVVTLDEIFECAEANSIQLRQSFTAQAEAQRDVDVARAGRLPDITASLSLSYIGDGFTTSRSFGDYQKAPIPHFGNGLSIGITQPVYTGGAVESSIQLAQLKSTAARLATDLARDNLRIQLAGLYLDMYKYANLRKVVESNIEAARKVLQEMRHRHEQGTVLLNDITRYELLTSNLDLQLVKINNTVDILNTNLVTIAGLPSGTVVEPDSTLLLRALPQQSADWWQAEAALNAPSLSIAQSAVDISRKAEDLVRSERLPKVGLQAGWSFDGPILVEVPPINRNLSYWYVGVGVSYNISSLFKTNRSMAKARVATRRAADCLDAARENVALAVNADYIRYLEAYENLSTCSKAVELATRNYDTVVTRYSADMALITDLLDAAAARLDAEQQLVNARIEIIYSYYKLLFTSGKI